MGHGMSVYVLVKSRYIGDGHPTFNRNPYDGYINPYYWVDDHPLLYGYNGSLDPGTYVLFLVLDVDVENTSIQDSIQEGQKGSSLDSQ